MSAHGGLFRTRGVASRFLAAAISTAVSVGTIATEGGAWGVAVPAAYAAGSAQRSSPLGLDAFLEREVLSGVDLETWHPDPADVGGFDRFVERHVEALPVEEAAAGIGS